MLENAVREYDREAGPILKDETKLSATRRTRNAERQERQERQQVKKEAETIRLGPGTVRPRCQTLSPQSTIQVPLTNMFKRSSSLPAPQKRTEATEPFSLGGSGNTVGEVASLSASSFVDNAYASEPQLSSPVSVPASPTDIGLDYNVSSYCLSPRVSTQGSGLLDPDVPREHVYASSSRTGHLRLRQPNCPRHGICPNTKLCHYHDSRRPVGIQSLQSSRGSCGASATELVKLFIPDRLGR